MKWINFTKLCAYAYYAEIKVFCKWWKTMSNLRVEPRSLAVAALIVFHHWLNIPFSSFYAVYSVNQFHRYHKWRYVYVNRYAYVILIEIKLPTTTHCTKGMCFWSWQLQQICTLHQTFQTMFHWLFFITTSSTYRSIGIFETVVHFVKLWIFYTKHTYCLWIQRKVYVTFAEVRI